MVRHINLDKIFHQVPQTGSALRLWCWATTLQRLLKWENLNVAMVEGSSVLFVPGLIQVPYWAWKVWQWGTSPTAPGTLGSYQTLDWARLACRGYHNREEPHLPFNTQHLLRYHIITAHGMVMVHDITSTVHQVGHLLASQNRITCQMSTTDVHQLHLWAWKNIKKPL